jgi:glycosyltransferase involved in cell wall biosynthesis
MKKNNIKPKVMIVAPFFPPQYGGLENYALNIAKGLQSNYNIDVFVVTSAPKLKKQYTDNYEGIRVYRLPTLIKFSNTPINPLWYFSIKKIIKNEKPDVINSHQPVPFIGDVAALAAGSIPFVLTYHAGTMKKGIFFIDLFINIYEKYILLFTAKKAIKVIASSKFVSKTIMKSFIKKTVVIHPGADVSFFKPNRKVIRKKNVILFICRYKNMHRLKGLYNVIKAVKKLPHVKIRVLGEIDETNRNSQIEFVGFLRGKELIKEIQNASLEIIAPLKHTDSYPTVLVEAMSCETPVIGTRSGGIPEMINNGVDGLLVDANNIKGISRAISTLLANSSLAKKMGQNGRKRVLNDSTWKSRVRLTYLVLKPYLI